MIKLPSIPPSGVKKPLRFYQQVLFLFFSLTSTTDLLFLGFFWFLGWLLPLLLAPLLNFKPADILFLLYVCLSETCSSGETYAGWLLRSPGAPLQPVRPLCVFSRVQPSRRKTFCVLMKVLFVHLPLETRRLAHVTQWRGYWCASIYSVFLPASQPALL